MARDVFVFEDTKRTMSPEMRPKGFGTFEKQAPGLTDWLSDPFHWQVELADQLLERMHRRPKQPTFDDFVSHVTFVSVFVSLAGLNMSPVTRLKKTVSFLLSFQLQPADQLSPALSQLETMFYWINMISFSVFSGPESSVVNSTDWSERWIQPPTLVVIAQCSKSLMKVRMEG